MRYMNSAGRMFSDSQRKAMFASMFSSSPTEISMSRRSSYDGQVPKGKLDVVSIDEDLLPVGRNLAYSGVVTLSGGESFEVFDRNLFGATIDELEQYSKLDGTKLASVADDIIDLRRRSEMPISIVVPGDIKGAVDRKRWHDRELERQIGVSSLPSLREYGLADSFDNEVIDTVEDTIDYDIDDKSDVYGFYDDLYDKSMMDPEVIVQEKIVEKEVLGPERIVEREVPIEITQPVQGGTVQVLDEEAGVYQYEYPDTVVVGKQEVKEVGTFDRFFGTPTVSRMEKELKEFDDEL